MEYIESILYWFLITMNVIGFFIMRYDKKQARKQRSRIQEQTIWRIAWFGGAVGVYLGMKQFRHKTKHKNFAVGLPILSIFNILLFIAILQYL